MDDEITWKPITVKSKITGECIQIKDNRFNPDIHEACKTKVQPKAKKVKKEVKEVTTEAEEFAQMKKDRAWLRPKKKDRYNELKEKLSVV